MSPRPRADSPQLEISSPGQVRRPPAPGQEVAGPPLTDLVYEMRRAVEGMAALYARARAEAQLRAVEVRAGGQTDASGNAAIHLYEVPQGATGYLTICALDEAGVDAGTPNTSATLWHGIFSGYGREQTRSQVVSVGSLLDCSPQSPGVDAQIPFVYVYGHFRCAPTLVGPQSFYVVISGANASRQIGIRGVILIEQPEP